MEQELHDGGIGRRLRRFGLVLGFSELCCAQGILAFPDGILGFDAYGSRPMDSDADARGQDEHRTVHLQPQHGRDLPGYYGGHILRIQ